VSEQALQQAVIQLARLLGIEWYHTHDSRRSRKGFPDLVLCGSRVLYRELKTETGKVTPEQQRWGDRLQQAGEDWSVWRPADLRLGDILRELTEIR
jgi:hypothetical protein